MEPASPTAVNGRRTTESAYVETREILTGDNEKLFPRSPVRQCKRLLREAVQSPSLQVFETKLDKALNNLVLTQS